MEILRGSSEPLAERHDVALLDLDGVVYRGGDPVPRAAEALAGARGRGMRLAFTTNNASRTPAEVVDALVRCGVPAEPDDVVTSAQAAAALLHERLGAGAPVLVLGDRGLREAVEDVGLRCVPAASDEPAAVVQGWTRDARYDDFAEATLAVRAGAWFVATNADATMPSPQGLLPGNGALVAVVRTATGVEPAVAGKPELPLHAEAVRRTGAQRPLVVGDRLDTDIEGAVRARCPSLLVLTGVSGVPELLAAPPQHRPTHVAADLRGLLAPHPAVEVADGAASCGAWRAVVDDGRARWDRRGGEGDALDGVRALAGAVWLLGADADPGSLPELPPLDGSG